jgi:NB-ARC domain
MVGALATSAISWGFSAAGWVISPVLTRLFNKCFDALGLDPPTKILLDKLNDLETTLLPQLLILTDAAQQSPLRPSLEKWIQKLKFAFYEAEHILGLVEYGRLKKQVNSHFPSSTSKYCNFKNFECKMPKFSSEKRKLIKSLKNLEDLVNDAMKFVPLLNLPTSSTASNSNWRPNAQYRETISTPSSVVIGRDDDRDHIVKLLKKNPSESSSNAKCYSVIGIWGMGGSGKTTLAQYICKHFKEKEPKHFDCILWFHVSEKFNVSTIFKTILESAFEESCLNLSNLEGLQSKLEEKLRGQKFFLVLDDVWCDKGVSVQELEQLFAPLRAGQMGSKVLVTTRIEEAAKALGDMNPIPLRELDEKQFFSLFMINALGDAQITDHLNKELTLIGKEIAAKLCRSPLAAKVVACQLRRRLDSDSWTYMKKCSLLNDIMGALLLSYQHLSPPLQRCFAFCGLFPKGHFFVHADLVNLWIAEGFIETHDNNEHMKNIANQYILELVSSSFFQVKKSDGNCYSIHDLMHDLAQHVSQGEYFRIESDEKREIPTQTRHICVVLDKLEEYMERICKLKYLCTIFVRTSFSNFCLKKVDLDALFTKSKKLHVVLIQAAIVERVPKSVVHLRNLRYLNLVTSLPEGTNNSLNKLYQLRFLYTRSQIPDIGRLIMLQDLVEFRIGTTSGFELKQLEHLKDLFGSLSIYGLHHVGSKDEAYRANISDKKGLHKLCLSWDYESQDVLRDIDIEILEGLCPPPETKELAIKGYSGKSLPSWISENNGNIMHLKHFELANCLGLEAVHRINELSHLVCLTISFLPRLKSWASLPLNLTQLDISHCFSLAFVLKEDLEMITSTRSTQASKIVTFIENSLRNNVYTTADFQFERVQEMLKADDFVVDHTDPITSTDLKEFLEKRLDLIYKLKDVCDNLSLPIALNKLSIKSCFITDKILARSFQCLTSLTHLILEDIITVTCIPKEVLNSLSNLMVVDISGCLLLRSIGGWDTHRTLQEFYIECCPNLILETLIAANSRGKAGHSILKKIIYGACIPPVIMESLVSLETLSVWDCSTIESLQVGHLKALVDLVVRHCGNLVSVKGLSELRNLKILDVVGCQKLESNPDNDKMLQPTKLYISRLSLVKGLVSRDGFSSLVSLELHDEQQEIFSHEELEVLCHLSSLEEIVFYRCKMQTLPTLSYLHSLKTLGIQYCVNLTSLPALPRSVEQFSMRGCNEEFTKSCKNSSHSNWQKISHIRNKHIR